MKRRTLKKRRARAEREWRLLWKRHPSWRVVVNEWTAHGGTLTVTSIENGPILSVEHT